MTDNAPRASGRPTRVPAVRAAAQDLGVTAAWFVVAGVLGAVLWWQLTPLPVATRTGEAASLNPDQLTKEVGIDGWFAVIALVAALVSGVVLMAWRRRDPLLMVVLIALGGGLAAYLMVTLGQALGPGDEVAALKRLPDGGTAPLQLSLKAPGVALLWPIAALFGALVQVWVLRRPEHRDDDDETTDPRAEEPDQPDDQVRPADESRV